MVQYNRCSSYAYSIGVFGSSNYTCIFVCSQSYSTSIDMFHRYSGIWILMLVLKTQRPSILFTCFCLYVLCIDLLGGERLENIDYSMLVVLISFFFVSKKGHEESSYILSFIMVSLIICLYFFTYGQSGAVEVSEDGRTAWKDSNYLGNYDYYVIRKNQNEFKIWNSYSCFFECCYNV